MRNSFITNVAALMSGTVAAQIIAFLFSLLLARLYQDVAFGHFSAFLSISVLLSVVATAAYDKAITFAESDAEERSIVALICVVAISVAISISILAAIGWASGFVVPIGLSYVDFGLWLPLSILMTVTFQLFLYTGLRVGRMGQLARAKIGQNLITGASQSALFSMPALPGLVIGYVFGFIASALPLWKNLRAIGFCRDDFSPATLKKTAKNLARYPKFTLPTELIDSASTQLQTLLIGVFFSLSLLGQYAFCQRILSAPAAVIGQAVGQAFFHQISGAANSPAGMRQIMKRVWLALAAIGIVPFTVLFLFGQEIFAFVFGQRWASAGRLAELSSILLFVRFVSSPTSSIYLKLKLQKPQIYFVFFALCYRVGSVLTYLIGFDIYQIIILHSCFEILFIIFYNAYVLRVISQSIE
jgi:lipopolysaccharide exporter